MRPTKSALLALAFAVVPLAGCGSKTAGNTNTTSSVMADSTYTGTTATSTDSTSAAYKHHSVLAGAAVGAVAGHALGKHAIAGAAVGALVQHERNKHAAGR